MIKYKNDSISISVPIKINGALITTSYTSGQLMNNPAVGFGMCRLTVFKSDGTIAQSNGVPIQDKYCYRDASNSGQGDLIISYGFQAADTYTIIPTYGVRNSAGDLDWREQEQIQIKVVATKFPINQIT